MGSWQQIWGPVRQVVIVRNPHDAKYDILASEGTTGDLYYYQDEPFSWTRIGGPGKAFVSTFDSRIHGLAPDGSSVWSYPHAPRLWTKIGGPAAAIYAGGNELYATDPVSGDLWEYERYPMSWTKIGGPGKTFVRSYYDLYGLAPDGSGVWMYQRQPFHWTRISGPARQLYGGIGGIFATAADTGDLYQGGLTYEGGVAWERIGGPGKTFVAAWDEMGKLGSPNDTILYGVFPDGSGLAKYNGSSHSWTQIFGPVGDVYAGGERLCITDPKTHELILHIPS